MAPDFQQLSHATTYLMAVTVAFAFTAALHLYRVFQIIGYSVVRCKMSFGPHADFPSATSKILPASTNKRVGRSCCCVAIDIVMAPVRHIRSWWRKYLGPHGLFGIYGPHYDRRIGLRELVDIPSHVMQAYYMSCYVRESWCIVVGIVVVIECWSHELLHGITHGQSLFSRRSSIVLLDIVLDTILGAVIPTALIIMHIIQYANTIVPMDVSYSDVWYAEAMLRLRQFAVKSFLDFFTKICPFVFNFWTLHTLSALLARTLMMKDEQLNHASASKLTQVVPVNQLKAARPDPLSKFFFRMSHVLRALAVLCGLGIALIVLMASGKVVPRQTCPTGCLLELSPWVSLECSCIVQQFNCIDLNLTGSELNTVLDDYTQPQLLVVIFNRCTQLRMPPSIRRLSEISTISIYNSDLIEWSKEAALTPDAFSIITYLQIVKSNLTEIPPGLLQELPRTLIDIQIIESAVPTAFPAVVSQRWANVTVLYVERCTLTDVPDAIMQLPKLDQLSLAHNNIHELPPHFFEATAIRTLRYLIMSANPLEALPTNLANASALLEMYLDQTDVAQLPASAFNSSLVVSAWNSTMCTSNAGGADDPRVNCHGLYGNIFRSGVYPLDPDIRAERVQNFLSDLVSN